MENEFPCGWMECHAFKNNNVSAKQEKRDTSGLWRASRTTFQEQLLPHSTPRGKRRQTMTPAMRWLQNSLLHLRPRQTWSASQ